MKIIFINAIAARSSGALSIIKDFYNYITDIKSVDIKYYLFTCIDEFQTNDSIEVVKLAVDSLSSMNSGLGVTPYHWIF